MRRAVQKVVRVQALRDQRNLFNMTVVASGLVGFWLLIAQLQGKLF
jgi:hypothetical protein